MTTRSGDLHIPTFCALTAIAFVVACGAHEVLGHGGACLACGGKIELLSSTLFRCAPPRTVVDAAGPLMSLITAAAAAAGLSPGIGSGLRRNLLALVFAIAGFWVSGELIASAITNTDDMAFVLRGLSLRPLFLWRIVMGLAGGLCYVGVLRRAASYLPTGKPLVAAYVTIAAVACIGPMLHGGDFMPGLRDGLLETLGSVGLLYLAFRRADVGITTLRRSRPTMALSCAIVALFWLVLGKAWSQPNQAMQRTAARPYASSVSKGESGSVCESRRISWAMGLGRG